MAEFKGSNNYVTVWGKLKTKQVRKGDNKGDDYEVYAGYLDLGGGKMLTLEVYADSVEPVKTKAGEEMFPFKVSKWKGNRQKKSSNSKSW